MKIRFLCALTLVLLMLAMASSGSMAGMTIELDGVKHELYQTGDWQYIVRDGSAEIFAYKGSDKALVIPATLNGHPVGTVGVGYKVVSGLEVTSVYIPDGVSTVSPFAFDRLETLTEVRFPATLSLIGSQAFYGTTALRQVSIPGGDGLVIDYNAFCSSGVESVFLGEGVVSVGSWAFGDTDALSYVELPATGLTALYECAFYSNDNAGLVSVDIPDSVTVIELPVIPHSATMIVGQGSTAMSTILAESYSNYTVRGQTDPDLVTEGDTPEERAAAIVRAVTDSSMTDYEKALALHDYLTCHAQYDVIAYHDDDGPKNYPDSFRPEGVLMNGLGVCQSYAEAYAIMLSKAGIANTLEYGAGHVWNMVMLEGEWTHVDVTWDDPMSAGQTELMPGPRSGMENHGFFGLTNYALEGVDSHECYNKPHVATDYRLNYAWRNGGLTARVEAVRVGVQARLDAGETAFSFVPEGFGTNEDKNDYGIRERLSLSAARDLTYTLTGYDTFEMEMTYDGATGAVSVTVILPKTERDLGECALTAEDAVALPLDGAVTEASVTEGSLVVNVSEDGAITFEGEGKAVVTAETDTEILTVTFAVRPMDTLYVNAAIVEDEAFKGTGAERVVLGPDVQTVGSGAFEDIGSLVLVRFEGGAAVPDTWQNSGAWIIAPEGSPAARYAADCGMSWLRTAD